MRIKITHFIACLLVQVICSTSFSQENAVFNLKKSEFKSAPGQIDTIEIKMDLPRGFKAYYDQFKILNISPNTYTAGQIKISPEETFLDPHSKKERTGFSEKGSVQFLIESPLEKATQDNQTVRFELKYQICSQRICYLPQKESFKVEMNYRSPASEVKTEISTEISPDTEPQNYFFNQIQTLLSTNIYYSFFIVFLAGILTSFTPCIFPMLPITLSILAQDAQKKSRAYNFVKSVMYVLGIATTYSTLGVIAAMTGSIFGNALANKYVVAGMVVLFLLMALSMWGIFEIQMPAFIRNKYGNKVSKGFLGAFIMGLLAGVVASPCVGPVLVSILTYVSTTKNVYLGFGLLFTYALGLGLIFIVIGLFSEMLKFLPKSGRWMNRIKFFLGLLMALTALYYASFLVPKNLFFSKNSTEQQATQGLRADWKNYSEALLAEAQQQNKPVIIDFFAEWCAACHELEDKTFSQSEFVEKSKEFILLKVDATEDTEAIQAVIAKYDIKGLPTILFINKKGELLKDLSFTQFLSWPELKPKMLKAAE